MPGTNLTRAEAAERARIISVESYHVDLDLTGDPETFRARTTVTFDAEAGAHTFIDAITASVDSVTLNGIFLDPAKVSDGERIDLPDLAEHNELVVDSRMYYMNTGEGLHRFVDPVDEQVYLYTQFEVADTRRMFPVFEQPDLKATFQFAVTAPADWDVVSNQPTPEPFPVADGVARWEFSPTPVISCYITALIAGPYVKTTDSLVSSDGRTIELGLFARRSLFEYVDAEEMFEVTKQGFEFFESQFGVPYPFEKYDQLFVPQFNAGAMENAGAVTFVESYVFRSKPAQARVERRAITVLHELAHMWFGDLVTMRWWNDLWLNESFAEYMSTLACAQNTRYTNAWTTFAAGEKSWGYEQDQLPTTHPIKAEIPDLEAVLVNFDGITYAKGASVLKQLVAWVGQEEFMAGLNRYFGKHAWSNTELSDLMVELEAASGRDLTDWSARWLETAGVNTLVPQVEADDDGVITSFRIEQLGQDGHPTLRPHRVAVGFYDHREDTGLLSRTFRVELDVDGEFTDVPQLVGRELPDLVLLNDDDLAYAKIRLDECSLATATTHLGDFEESLPRSLVWAAAWDSVHDGVSPARDYVDLVLSNVGHETDSTAVQVQLRQLDVALDRYLAPEHADQVRARAADTLWDLTAAAEAGSDHQWQFFRAFLRRACTEAHFDRIEGFFDGGVPEGIELDTDTRWAVLIALVAAGRKGAEDVDRALDEDNTETGAIAAATARAAIPTPEAKAEAWRLVVSEGALPNSQQQAAIAGFFRVHDDALVTPYSSRYFDAVTGVWTERTHELAQQIAVGLFPRAVAQETVDAAQAFLDRLDPALSGLRRIVLERQDAARRAVRAQAVDAAAVQDTTAHTPEADR
ncbi:aminopeptidase N [Kocuria marina]|uniref:Aminopeptidase N n=1 Tax=Kocuria marina subsp. indica TaxID=1049583 RepID=A0A1X7DTN7_9MICC|nr:aminopeptidase N [Kocuria indica]OXS81542.1 aminopeptidase N [Kocuria indica]RLP57126.1 aminopeptidase N [Kocuria indica]SMF21276.1 aminopeptidase N [Kocuria indica]